MSATIGTRLFTLFRGHFVGEDEFGNRYFEERGSPRAGQRLRRWVVYNGVAEPTKIPPHWHGWIHYTHERPLTEQARRYFWQKPHNPNLTGTVGRYLPPGHIEKGGVRSAATSDYQPWRPE